jgi:hypothetical protein
MSTLDLLILIPLLPIVLIAITWWLPWERWIAWDELPKSLLGPYLLYGAFAAWHFKFAWWSVVILVLAGTVLSIMTVMEKTKKWKRANYAQQ